MAGVVSDMEQQQQARLTGDDSESDSASDVPSAASIRGSWLQRGLFITAGCALALVVCMLASTKLGETRAAKVRDGALKSITLEQERSPFFSRDTSSIPDLNTDTPFTKTIVDAIPGKLLPREDRNDGNVCGDDEELTAGLCYKKCSLLTQGQYPIRTAPNACCRNRPCTLFNSHITIVPCQGLDVAGDAEGVSACPHAPGACLKDEELYLGKCYAKCSLLTNGKYPYRFAGCSCCNQEGLGCLLPINSITSAKLCVGGGKGDRNNATPDQVHDPIPELTEISAP